MIEAENLTKYYGEIPAIMDVSFSAEKGEILGFLGPNGAGKTTTMRILTCYLPPSSGSARVAGFDVLEDSVEVRKRIGYVPENVPIYTDLSVSGYLEFIAKLKGMSKNEHTKRIGQIMEECGIYEVKDRIIGKLSKGYKQRVGIAQALINDPEVLIFDEPTVGLDPKQIIDIRELIRDLSGRRTIILSTHILPEVSLLCQRIIIINKGKLVTCDTAENLRYHFRPSMVFDLLVRGEPDRARTLVSSLPDVQSVNIIKTDMDTASFRVEATEGKDVREEVARNIVSNGMGLLGLTQLDLSLEDIFVQLVTEEEA